MLNPNQYDQYPSEIQLNRVEPCHIDAGVLAQLSPGSRSFVFELCMEIAGKVIGLDAHEHSHITFQTSAPFTAG
ncbi:unnamed protein product [Ambrosiozyma monospora]|uniref:Unnamed protein product n=1 Tax=Ambrosiozyma monospora TaxID=43982 RepID=A0ACB5T6W9_AMBMO|nr:unnamed protein product [Ambrosiozyma monospora]